jgi:predicted nucleic acid-binding protein
LNGQEEAILMVNKLAKFDLATSVICVAEILEGLTDIRNKEKLKIFVDFLKNIDIFDIDLYVADVYSKIRSDQRKKGELIDKFDLLIASTCIANDLTLVTGNIKHFKRVKNLKIYH